MATLSDVAVLICSRERAALLSNALRVMRLHTSSAVEVIVVDSASTTDATRRVALDAGVKYVRTDIKGLSIARNIGLASTERQIVVYTDDDCEATPGWIEALLPHFSSGVGGVTGLLLDADAVASTSGPPSVLTRTRQGLDAGHGAIMSFDRRLLLRIGGFDEVLGTGRTAAGAEDLDIFCRVLRHGETIVREPGAAVRHIYTRDDSAFAELNRGYGLGLGAMASKWIRFDTLHGIALLGIMILRGLSRAIRHRRNRRMRTGAMMLLSGTFIALARYARNPLSGQCFVDEHPPEPIAIVPEHRESIDG